MGARSQGSPLTGLVSHRQKTMSLDRRKFMNRGGHNGYLEEEEDDVTSMDSQGSLQQAISPCLARNYLELRAHYSGENLDQMGKSPRLPRKELIIAGKNMAYRHRANLATARMLKRGYSLNSSKDEDFYEEHSDCSMPRSVSETTSIMAARPDQNANMVEGFLLKENMQNLNINKSPAQASNGAGHEEDDGEEPTGFLTRIVRKASRDSTVRGEDQASSESPQLGRRDSVVQNAQTAGLCNGDMTTSDKENEASDNKGNGSNQGVEQKSITIAEVHPPPKSVQPSTAIRHSSTSPAIVQAAYEVTRPRMKRDTSASPLIRTKHQHIKQTRRDSSYSPSIRHRPVLNKDSSVESDKPILKKSKQVNVVADKPPMPSPCQRRKTLAEQKDNHKGRVGMADPDSLEVMVEVLHKPPSVPPSNSLSPRLHEDQVDMPARNMPSNGDIATKSNSPKKHSSHHSPQSRHRHHLPHKSPGAARRGGQHQKDTGGAQVNGRAHTHLASPAQKPSFSPATNMSPYGPHDVGGAKSKVGKDLSRVLCCGGVGLHDAARGPHDLVVQLLESAVCLYLGEEHLVRARNQGTLQECLTKASYMDNNIVMGHVLRNVAAMTEGSGVGRHELQAMMDLCQAQRAEGATQMHVRATVLSSQGYLDRAVWLWEDILQDQPLNILAIKFAHDGYIRLGMLKEMVLLTTRLMPHWKPVMPFYGQILNLHAYSLCENGLLDEAESLARKSLELDGSNVKAIHSLVHVYYMRHDWDQGIDLLRSTTALWMDSERLACHYLWHWALFYIKLKDYNTALNIWDTQLKPRALRVPASFIFPLLDAASLLFRLSMQGLRLQQRWLEVYRVLSRHQRDHVWVMNDLHILMAALGTNEPDLVKSFKDSLQIYIQNGTGTNHRVTKEIGLTLCEAMVCYDNANHERVVDLLYPIRGQFHKIGGTQTQRDIFHEILISSAGKSRMPSHQKLVRQLLEEKRVP